jgi:hypothetical protein
VVEALVRAGIPIERVGRSRRLEDAFLALIAAPPAAENGQPGPPAQSGEAIPADPAPGAGEEMAGRPGVTG